VGERFGIKHVVDVLRGADTERIRRLGHAKLSTYGIGSDMSDAEWTSLVRQLIHRGLVLQDIGNYSVLRLTPAARPVLRGERELVLARPRIKSRSKRRSGAAAALEAADTDLFEALRALRKGLAEAQGVPPYVIFGDATLVEMSRRRPASGAELLEITGVGQKKLERYGADFLDVIAMN
jgi:ATP-dependent DNA helicase RecQ